MPVVHPDGPRRVFACELNLQPGEAFPDPKLVQIQTSIQQDWSKLIRDSESPRGVPLTVADALIGTTR